MDRPEPGLIKWSPNAKHDSFLHINLQHRVVQLYEPTGHARRDRFDYRRLSKHDDFPPLTTYDWSPTNPGLLAVGTGSGIVNLLRIDDNSNAYLELGLKMTRTCQAVAFNTEGLLAVGLDRVRMDQCLHIWDVRRLSSPEKGATGFPKNMPQFGEPLYRLEPSVSVSSVKFFEDDPQTLVVGIKGQGLRIHDLREPSVVTTFQTRCNNNLAIDYADQNYFTSSALDQPGIMIWDRRATARPVVSHSYLQAVDEDELPWGGALRLDRAIETDQDPSLDSKHSFIRSLRYCRDRRGVLAVLSRTGQLKILNTIKEPSDGELEGSPELLQVQRSYDMDISFADASRKQDRIVSFDWVTLGSPVLRSRLLVLRASGALEILEQPSYTSDHLFKLIPWKAPHRGLEEEGPYQSLMQFEPAHTSEMVGPLIVEQALSDIPIFGPEKADLELTIKSALESPAASAQLIYNEEASKIPLPPDLKTSSTIAERLRILRNFARDVRAAAKGGSDKISAGIPVPDTLLRYREIQENLLSKIGTIESPPSCRELHESLLTLLPETKGLPREAQSIMDHAMLLRAKEKYLLDPAINMKVTEDDPWLRYLWNWIEDAEAAAADGGMVQSPLDLSYLGIYAIWMNDLGQKSSLRLADGSSNLDSAGWERCIASICKKRYLPKYHGVNTKKPHHRQLCLDICGWGRQTASDFEANNKLGTELPRAIHTMEAAKAFFRGDTDTAIQILNKASETHSELLFISLALQLMGREDGQISRERLDFDEALASKSDPYIKGIATYLATGDWAAIASQDSLPISDRAFIAFRNFSDDQITAWLEEEVAKTVATADIEGLVLTGISDRMIDILAGYVARFGDVQTAALVTALAAPRYVDDYRCAAWRKSYRAHLQRHREFFARTRFEVESTKRSKRDGRPMLKPPSRQVALRCVYCDAETTLSRAAGPPTAVPTQESRNPLMAASIGAGISCPTCGRHLPRCIVCLEVVGIPRSDKPENSPDADIRLAARFPTFCLKCEHVLHLDHARQWFARHAECPVPECRCRCNFKANPELSYH